jgi:hypothetical protein
MRDEILGVLEPIELTGLSGFRDHGKTKKLILPAKIVDGSLPSGDDDLNTSDPNGRRDNDNRMIWLALPLGIPKHRRAIRH